MSPTSTPNSVTKLFTMSPDVVIFRQENGKKNKQLLQTFGNYYDASIASLIARTNAINVQKNRLTKR